MALSACSSEDDAINNGNIDFKGDVAYLRVNIQDVSAGTRATTDGDFKDGVKAEHTVSTAHFYFFDLNGTFLSKGSVWNGGAMDDPKNDNIEYIGKNVVVLDNLQERGLPSYMLTVLNQPAGFQPEATLEATSKKLVDWNSSTADNTNSFVMATTNYYKDGTGDAIADHNSHYYVTKVTSDDFQKEPVLRDENGNFIDENGSSVNVVNVYVERLAAKVEMKEGDGLANKITIGTGDDAKTYYKVTATVAGNENIEGKDDMATSELYVRIDGWGLNATANNSYLSKQLDNSWIATAPFTNWNVDNFFRSYWGKSTVYGEDVANYTAKNLVTYKKYSELNIAFPGVGYCNENTNTAAKINPGNPAVFDPAAVTSVLVKATICDKNGQPLDMVRYNGLMFTKDQFLQYALNTIDLGKGNLNVWIFNHETTETVDNVTTTTIYCDQIDKNSVELDFTEGTTGAGDVNLISKLDDTKRYFYKNAEGKFVEFADVAAATAALDGYLATAPKGEAFTGGKMYYNIPIEHLGALTATPAPNPLTQEGYYGVVRNHWYELTITEIAKLGNGVFTPDTGEDDEREIIPDPKKDTYYLGAQINILSWKLVKQNVSL